ncbi:hypothetical protein QFC22_005691 [Naganishia vaughanmartiniae]|uniref:Uncharacterized protein n=1 Tax=Naganishia vaughanmartiniae TaxID=1424756 RepID=A0ACC2WSU1_9TREE|nr:hypothetical protein QFC22_005691 [Naganishia vaughanmartiniae]
MLVSLSQTCSSLRTWLLEDESIWNKALLGRGMGRPLYSIPGYEGYSDWESAIREAHKQIRDKAAVDKALGQPLNKSHLPALGQPLNKSHPSALSQPLNTYDLSLPPIVWPEDRDKAQSFPVGNAGQQRTDSIDLRDRSSRASEDRLPPSASRHLGATTNLMDQKDENMDGEPEYTFPITCRDLCFRIYAHERKCLSCKVGDSKLSHYYLTDSDLRNADKVGVHPTILNHMGNNWGFGTFEPAHFDAVLGVREARTKAVRTAKFFVGYDFFGFCPYTLAIRIRTKAEPLTQPALCKIEISVFIPARRISAAIDRSTNQPVFFGPEVCYISSFTVENYNGVTLGDFQRTFEKWVKAPMPLEEAKEFEEKGAYFSTKGKQTSRLALIPEK